MTRSPARRDHRIGALIGARLTGRSVGSRLDRIGLAPRLFLTDLLVIIAGAGTLLAVALLIAPQLFHSHLQQAHLPVISSEVRDHVDEAFDHALFTALGFAVAAATLAALTISWLVARRLATSVHDVADAARRLADGHYRTPVPDPRLGPEFGSLAGSMNLLSRRLATTEADRRRLTADVAHQLRTPVAAVHATVEALIDGVMDPDHETLTVLAQQTQRLGLLIADLEKASRAAERQLVLHSERQPPEPVVRRCVAAARGRCQAKGVDITEDLTTDVPDVRIDADRIAEALGNLLDNALRHTPAGATIAVTLRRTAAGTTGEAPRAGVELTVRDPGDGFAPDQASLLFERYHRGPGVDPGSGSGLGLTIARAIVEAHGGTLAAHSEGPGLGATFTMTLPAA